MAVVAIGHVAGREIACERKLLGPVAAKERCRSVLGIAAVVASRGADAHLAPNWRSSNEVHGSANRVGPIQGRSAPVEHFDFLDRFKRNWEVQIMVSGLGIVHPNTVTQHKRLAK